MQAGPETKRTQPRRSVLNIVGFFSFFKMKTISWSQIIAGADIYHVHFLGCAHVTGIPSIYVPCVADWAVCGGLGGHCTAPPRASELETARQASLAALAPCSLIPSQALSNANLSIIQRSYPQSVDTPHRLNSLPPLPLANPDDLIDVETRSRTI